MRVSALLSWLRPSRWGFSMAISFITTKHIPEGVAYWASDITNENKRVGTIPLFGSTGVGIDLYYVGDHMTHRRTSEALFNADTHGIVVNVHSREERAALVAAFIRYCGRRNIFISSDDGVRVRLEDYVLDTSARDPSKAVDVETSFSILRVLTEFFEEFDLNFIPVLDYA